MPDKNEDTAKLFIDAKNKLQEHVNNDANNKKLEELQQYFNEQKAMIQEGSMVPIQNKDGTTTQADAWGATLLKAKEALSPELNAYQDFRAAMMFTMHLIMLLLAAMGGKIGQIVLDVEKLFRIRFLSNSENTALPDMTFYVALDDNGKLKVDLDFDVLDSKKYDDDIKPIFIQAIEGWLRNKGYEKNNGDGTFSNNSGKLNQAAFEGLKNNLRDDIQNCIPNAKPQEPELTPAATPSP